MNKIEVLKIMAILEVSYPNWVSKLDNDKKNIMVNLWTELFIEDDGNLIANAIKAIIISDTNPFPPTIAAIKQKAYDLSHKQAMSEMEAWNITMLALRNCGRNSVTEYEKLPKEIRVITTPQQLQEWSQMDIDQLNTVVASNFMRSYRSRSQYVKQNELLPNSMKVLLGEIKEQFKIENKDLQDGNRKRNDREDVLPIFYKEKSNVSEISETNKEKLKDRIKALEE